MDVKTSTLITTKQVVNEKTGEIEEILFEEQKKTKNIKGGWLMTYHLGYDLVITLISSKREKFLMIGIKNLFTKSITEVNLSPSVIAKQTGYDSKFISKTIKKLIAVDLIMQLSNKSYRLNPFIVVPYQADAEKLQKEWIKIRKEGKYLRRGKDLYDNFKDSKYTSFKEFYKDLVRGKLDHVYEVIMMRNIVPKYDEL